MIPEYAKVQALFTRMRQGEDVALDQLLILCRADGEEAVNRPVDLELEIHPLCRDVEQEDIGGLVTRLWLWGVDYNYHTTQAERDKLRKLLEAGWRAIEMMMRHARSRAKLLATTFPDLIEPKQDNPTKLVGKAGTRFAPLE